MPLPTQESSSEYSFKMTAEGKWEPLEAFEGYVEIMKVFQEGPLGSCVESRWVRGKSGDKEPMGAVAAVPRP